MTHEKIMRRGDGSRVKIRVDYYDDGYRGLVWRVLDVCKCKKRCSSFKGLSSHLTNNYDYRQMDTEERKACEMNGFLRVVTKAEINEVFAELYAQIKPPMI